MDAFDHHVSENETAVSDPLKHLLSLDLDSSTSICEEMEQEHFMRVKKVRFSDDVKQFSCEDDEEVDLSTCDEEYHDVYKQDDNNICDDLASTKLSFFESTDKESLSEPLSLEVTKTPFSHTMTDNSENAISFQHLLGYDNKHSSENFQAMDMTELSYDIEGMSLETVKQDEACEPSEIKEVISHEAEGNVESLSELALDAKDDETCSSLLMKKKKQNIISPKQSGKINVELTKDLKYANASELKTTVFKAWCKVKSETKETAEKKSGIRINVRRHKSSTSKRAFVQWKKTKSDALKITKSISKNSVSSSLENTKLNDEEREMAFKSWKKKKDEISKQKLIEKHQKERETTMESLLKENEKIKDAEEAFSAWKEHKQLNSMVERKKKAWLLEKEQEENDRKLLREKEAIEMYYLWLETKHSSTKYSSSYPMKEKPPWFPP